MSVSIDETQNTVHQQQPSGGNTPGDDTPSQPNLASSFGAETLARLKANKLKQQHKGDAAFNELDLLKPPTPNYAIVKVFHLNKWTRRFAVLMFLGALLAAFVPQFLYYVPRSHTFGLSMECEGQACLPANLTKLRTHPSCAAECNSAGGFRNRFAAASGMLWLSVVAAGLLATIQYLHYGRRYIVPLNGIMYPTLAVLVFGVATYVSGLAIFGSTVTVGYEATSCSQSEGCLVYGASSYVAVFGLILFFVAGLAGLIACLFHRHRLGVKSEFFEKLIQDVTNQESEKELASTRSLMYHSSTQPGQDDDAAAAAAADHGGEGMPLTTSETSVPPPMDSATTGLPPTEAEAEKARLAASDKQNEAKVVASAGLVSQESHFYAGNKDGDFDSSDDDDDDDDEEDNNNNNNKNKDGDEEQAPLTNIGDAENPAAAASTKKNPIVKEIKVKVRSSRSWQRVFNQTSIFCAGLAALFCMGSVLSPRWIFLSPGNTSKLSGYSIGLVAECTDQSCTLIDYDKLLINNTCGRDIPTLRARLGLSAIFYLCTAIFSVPLYLTSSKAVECLRGTTKRKVFTGVTWFMALCAVAISMDTFDNWITCDRPWCEVFLSENEKGSCEYGFMFGMSLMTICLATLLLTMNMIQSCCRPCGYELPDGAEGGINSPAGKKDPTSPGVMPSSPFQLDPGASSSSGGGGGGGAAPDDDDDDDEHGAPPAVHGDTPMHSGDNVAPNAEPTQVVG